ncbi:MAG: hypothetical protein IJ529_04005 [Alphaproteobacteria bacterium]|nr:hypothetical protein [Alphaproteobacteria bacterium]MBR1600230.1 hypothetical protein [Alphaproteobacteria bacterium]
MKKYLYLTLLFLCGCATQVTLLKEPYPAKNPNDVKVVIGSSKKICEAEEIALIRTPEKWNQTIAIAAAKEKAAEIGADYIDATVFYNNFNDASVVANAYKCIK